MKDPIIVDIESGTYFSAENAVLIDWSRLNPSEIETFINGSDTERSELAEEIGRPVA